MHRPSRLPTINAHAVTVTHNKPGQQPLCCVVCRWKGLKKKMLNRREQLAALQQAEAVEIRRKSDAFAERVDEFRKWV